MNKFLELGTSSAAQDIPISDPSNGVILTGVRPVGITARGEGISVSGRRMAQSQLNDRTLAVGLCLGGRGRKPKIIILGGSAEGGTAVHILSRQMSLSPSLRLYLGKR